MPHLRLATMQTSDCECCGAEIPVRRQLAIQMFGLRPLCLECANPERLVASDDGPDGWVPVRAGVRSSLGLLASAEPWEPVERAMGGARKGAAA